MTTEAAARADFSFIRYAQCWEDADILLEALNVREGDVCLSVASAGENSLSLLTCNPARVIAVDMNPAQLSCLALRVAAYRTLRHEELLQQEGATVDSFSPTSGAAPCWRYGRRTTIFLYPPLGQ